MALRGDWNIRCINPNGCQQVDGVGGITRQYHCSRCDYQMKINNEDGHFLVVCPDGHAEAVSGGTELHTCQAQIRQPDGTHRSCGKQARK